MKNSLDSNVKCVVDSIFKSMGKYFQLGVNGSHAMSRENIYEMCNLVQQGEFVWEIGFGVPYLALALAAVSGTEIYATDADNEGKLKIVFI